MLRNVFYDTIASQIHLWETIKGERLYDIINWVPYFFQKTSKSDIKAIDGTPVVKKTFNTYQEYSTTQKQSINIFENKANPAIQFLAERYHNVSDADMIPPELKIYSIDIEVVGPEDEGYSSPEEAKHTITLINIKHFGGKSYSWGLKKYTGDYDHTYGIEYKKLNNEMDLLKSFFLWFNKNTPDVLTGWNIMADNKKNKFGGYDLPYIINRCINLFGEKTKIYQKFSPINRVRKWISKNTQKMNILIAGVEILDYQALYKWYTTKNQPNYRLDTICLDELGKGKLDYSEYGNLTNLYKENFNKYFDYNVIDNVRIEELEEKLGYIKLAQSLSLLCKTPMKDYNASVAQIEGLFLTHYRQNNLCAPFFAGGSPQEHFPAAYVKEPQKGLHNWVIDIDIASSYPTSIILLNISPETYLGRVTDISEKEIIRCIKQKKFDVDFTFIKTTGITKMKGEKLADFNLLLKYKKMVIAPCGTVLDNTKRGVYALVEKGIFFKRKAVKKQMFGVRLQASKETDPKKKEKLLIEADRLFSTQWALKIVLNQAFGILAVPYSRYHNRNLAEAITSASKYNILYSEKICNELMNGVVTNDIFSSEMEKIKEEINNS